MTDKLRLSVLDLAPVVAGSSASTALRNTIDLARHVDRLGYTRYWLAEHHNTASIASSSPEILIGHVAAATQSIRVGSGGIMLPNHSSLKVAENFRTLEALHPGRIDLGIGRAPGTDPLTAMVLRRSSRSMFADDFPQQLHDLLGFLEDNLEPDHPYRSVTASPTGVQPPELWMLGSSRFGGAVAAQIGVGFAFAHHINPDLAVEALRSYRETFQPSRYRSKPNSILAISVVCAETDERAEELSASHDVARLQISRGRPQPLLRVEDALRYPWTADEEAQRRINRKAHFAGSPATVRQQIEELARAAQVDEVMVRTTVYDHGDRLRSYELLGDEF